MLHFGTLDLAELKTITWAYYKRKPAFFNFYFNDFNGLEYYENGISLILRRKEHDFHRIYFFSDDLDNLKTLLNQMEGRAVINIPVQSETCSLQPFLESCGYIFLARYDRLSNPRIEVENQNKGIFATEEHCQEIIKLMNDYFDPRTDLIPESTELSVMISNQQVLINLTEDKVTGFIIYTMEKGKCYINLWLDIRHRGLELMNSVYCLMKEKDVHYVYLWVKSSNTRAMKIYHLLGTQPEGVYDFSFYKS